MSARVVDVVYNSVAPGLPPHIEPPNDDTSHINSDTASASVSTMITQKGQPLESGVARGGNSSSTPPMSPKRSNSFEKSPPMGSVGLEPLRPDLEASRRCHQVGSPIGEGHRSAFLNLHVYRCFAASGLADVVEEHSDVVVAGIGGDEMLPPRSDHRPTVDFDGEFGEDEDPCHGGVVSRDGDRGAGPAGLACGKVCGRVGQIIVLLGQLLH